MAHFSAECVLWHSEPGACRWQFVFVTGPGDPIEDGLTQTIAIPEVPEASPLAFIVTLFCVPQGEGGNQPLFTGARSSPVWIDPLGNPHTGTHYSDRWSRMSVFPLAGTAGGHVDCVVGTNTLNLISGYAVCSGNGEAVAMVVDPMVTNPGDTTIASMVWDNAGAPAIQLGSGIDVRLNVAETLVRTDETEGTLVVNDGMVIGSAMSTSGGSSLTADSVGWTEIVQDNQTGYVATGVFRGPLPPSFGSLAVYDNATVPVNDQMVWHNQIASPVWWTAAAWLRFPVVFVPERRGSRSFAQVIG